jgi:preprotein translocase subunit SecE
MNINWLAQFRQYVFDVRSEMRKVVWPGRKETTTTTLIVFGMVAVMSLFLWLIDALLSTLVHLIVR